MPYDDPDEVRLMCAQLATHMIRSALYLIDNGETAAAATVVGNELAADCADLLHHRIDAATYWDVALEVDRKLARFRSQWLDIAAATIIQASRASEL